MNAKIYDFYSPKDLADLNITANVRTRISANGDSAFSVGLATKLGELPPPLSEKYKKLKNNP